MRGREIGQLCFIGADRVMTSAEAFKRNSEKAHDLPSDHTRETPPQYSGSSSKTGVGHHLAAATDPLTNANPVEKEAMAASIMPTPADTAELPTKAERQARLLQAMRQGRDQRDTLARQELALIEWARAEGATWQDIGAALGLTATGARLAWHRWIRAQAEAALT